MPIQLIYLPLDKYPTLYSTLRNSWLRDPTSQSMPLRRWLVQRCKCDMTDGALWQTDECLIFENNRDLLTFLLAWV